jgi:NAD+ synthase (glutamine-hydrolysing)
MGNKRTAHSLINRGCEIILNPSASHFAFGKTMVREELGLSLTKQYNCSYLLVNLLGNEAGRMIFDGDIQFHQNGKLKYKAERLSLKRIDCHKITVDTENPSNSSEYKPTDWFFKNEEFTISSTLALFDYSRKTKSKGFVLSLSGGADSSLCAVLIAHMIRRMVRNYDITDIAHFYEFKVPPKAQEWPEFKRRKYVTEKLLTCIYQSTGNSSSDTYESARKLAATLGAEFFLWSVDDEIENYVEKSEFVLGRKLKWENDDIALQNIQARVRAPGIWMLANSMGKLLITTSNRSEASVGYATMDGDTAGSLSPIAGVDKHFVRRYLLWAEEELGYEGLNDVNNLDPSAELRPSDQKQSDETDLMPYFILNKIEQKAIGEWKSPIEVFDDLVEEIPWPHGKLKTYIAKFFRLWSYNQWKRERYAPSFHFDDYNVDPKTWCRFPIISGSFKKEISDLMDY